MKNLKPRNFKERLSVQPHYAVLRRDENGDLLGWIEHSFSMGWSKTEVRVWPYSDLIGSIKGFPNKTFHCGKLGTRTYVAKTSLKEWCANDAFLVRIRTKKCPIVVDESVSDAQKYNYRNKPFQVKNLDIKKFLT